MNKTLSDIKNGDFFVIAGPCAIENHETPKEIIHRLKHICDQYNLPLIFKGSYRKANRSALNSFTGIGDLKALNILKELAREFDVPVTTDVHTEEEAIQAADYVDIIQIPAFLCRQTNLLLGAASTGKIVNIKKGQFMSPESMRFAVEKVKSKTDQVWLTERGTTFGYQNLVVDFPGIKEMQGFCDTVIMDCTHALQRPNQSKGITGGNPEMIETMALAATAIGANGLFIETHPDPANAKSDGANMLHLDRFESLLEKVMKIRSVIN
jgi:2-dehydro-3-deoxyphosphooctonate aldolase (KDO 8-P synthase)